MLIPARGHRLHCDLLGPETGPVACFAHALSADSGIWAEQVAPLLALGWRVVRLDMRGHGGSDPVPGDYDMGDLAGDVLLVLDFLGLDRVHFIGLSIGGMIGQTLAVDHRHRLISLMLCGTAPAAIPGGKALWDARYAAMDEAGSVEPLADATMERWFTDEFRSRRPDRWRQIRETVAHTTTSGYRGGGRAISNFDIVPKLPTVTTPTLVLWGDQDPGTPPAGNRLIAERIPGARAHEIADARHVPNVEYHEIFNRFMVDWLSLHL